jgi:hypothetical protein
LTNENDSIIIDQKGAWNRHIAMQLQSTFLQGVNPVLRALTAEAQRKLGISQEEANGESAVERIHCLLVFFFV